MIRKETDVQRMKTRHRKILSVIETTKEGVKWDRRCAAEWLSHYSKADEDERHLMQCSAFVVLMSSLFSAMVM